MGPLESASESYLIRIYRRDTGNPRLVAGLVELIEAERTETFKNVGELLGILGISDGTAGDTKGEKK